MPLLRPVNCYTAHLLGSTRRLLVVVVPGLCLAELVTAYSLKRSMFLIVISVTFVSSISPMLTGLTLRLLLA